jgi:hypothetical protein
MQVFWNSKLFVGNRFVSVAVMPRSAHVGARGAVSAYVRFPDPLLLLPVAGPWFNLCWSIIVVLFIFTITGKKLF